MKACFQFPIPIKSICLVINNKTGLKPVSRHLEQVHYLKGGRFLQSPFGAKAVQTVTLLAMQVSAGWVCYAKAKEDWRHLWRHNKP